MIGESKDRDSRERMAGERVEMKRSVVIMGAGGIGREITRQLSGTLGISIRVVERDIVVQRGLEIERALRRPQRRRVQVGGEVHVLSRRVDGEEDRKGVTSKADDATTIIMQGRDKRFINRVNLIKQLLRPRLTPQLLG